jgi:glutathione S-transferase
MKLYFAPGACSLSPHIVLRESGTTFDLEQVDLKTKQTKAGADYLKINPKGQVPVLQLDNGEVLTEGPAIVQYVADQKPGSGLVPAAGSLPRYHVMEWLNYITSELHKSIGALFSPTTPDAYKTLVTKEQLPKKFAYVDQNLAGKQYLTGDNFSVADAYLFTVINWTNFLKIDISDYPNLKAFQARVAQRPKVQEALKAEGLVK